LGVVARIKVHATQNTRQSSRNCGKAGIAPQLPQAVVDVARSRIEPAAMTSASNAR
jgi:hypothetical protein